MVDDAECVVRKEVARGRTCDGQLEGLDQLVPDLRRARRGEEPPKTRYHVDWIGGGVLVSYDVETYKNWECGDLHQPFDERYKDQYSAWQQQNMKFSTNNDYQYWYIRVYDHTGEYPYAPYEFDDPDTPDYIPPRCYASVGEEPTPSYFVCDCRGASSSDANGTVSDGGDGERGTCGEVVSASNATEMAGLIEACQERVKASGYDEQCGCTPPEEPEEPEKPKFTPNPPQPEPDPPPESSWGDGATTERKSQWWWPGWAGPSGSGPTWSDIIIPPPPQTPDIGIGGPGPNTPPCVINLPDRPLACQPLIRVDCPDNTDKDLRKVDPEVKVPMKDPKLEFGIDEITGLEDATYYNDAETTP